MIKYVAVGGERKISTVTRRLQGAAGNEEQLRLPTRTETAVDTATPRSSEASPKPLNQEKRFYIAEHVLEKGQHDIATHREWQ